MENNFKDDDAAIKFIRNELRGDIKSTLKRNVMDDVEAGVAPVYFGLHFKSEKFCQDAANRLNISIEELNEIISDSWNPTLERLIKIFHALDLRIEITHHEMHRHIFHASDWTQVTCKKCRKYFYVDHSVKEGGVALMTEKSTHVPDYIHPLDEQYDKINRMSPCPISDEIKFQKILK